MKKIFFLLFTAALLVIAPTSLSAQNVGGSGDAKHHKGLARHRDCNATPKANKKSFVNYSDPKNILTKAQKERQKKQEKFREETEQKNQEKRKEIKEKREKEIKEKKRKQKKARSENKKKIKGRKKK